MAVLLLLGLSLTAHAEDNVSVRQALDLYQQRARDLNTLISRLIFHVGDDASKMEELSELANISERLEKQHRRLYDRLRDSKGKVVNGSYYCINPRSSSRSERKRTSLNARFGN